MKNLILIGMPGCGKSTVGVVLAKVLCKSFLDSDLVIQQRHGRALQTLINTYGVDQFLDLERDAVCSIEEENFVIATGGSVIYRDEAMQHLKQLGTILYLQLSCEEMKKRLTNLATRGVALPAGQTLEKMYESRRPLYERYADWTVSCDGKTVMEIVSQIKEKWYAAVGG